MMIATNAEPIRLTGKIISDIDKCIYMSESNHLASTDDPRGIDGNIERYLIAINNYFNSLNENLRELKEKIFLSFNKMRIYTKQPRKPADDEPVIMPQKSTVKSPAPQSQSA